MPIMVKKPEVPRVEIQLDFRYGMDQLCNEFGNTWKKLLPRPELDLIDLTLKVVQGDGQMITIVGQFKSFEASWSTPDDEEGEVVDEPTP